MFLRASLVVFLIMFPPSLAAAECVVLLHGLLRTSWSMEKVAAALEERGYETVNVAYPSRDHPVEELAGIAVGEGLRRCRERELEAVNFVTHSLGGILLRQYAENRGIEGLDRAVMLGPPNQGSEVADALEDVPGFEWLAGPAGGQLGTEPTDVPARLGPVDFELGVIAGTSALNPLFSMMVPDPDDGTVSVESTRVEGMCAMLEIPATHFWMMRNERVIEQTVEFLEHGEFSAPEAENGLCSPQARG